MVKDAQKSRKPVAHAADEDKFDQVVIRDRTPPITVDQNHLTSAPEVKPQAFGYRQLVTSAAADSHAMIDKLKSEIAHLEKWLSQQKSGRQRSSLSVANTIRALIATRQSLLDSLEKRMK